MDRSLAAGMLVKLYVAARRTRKAQVDYQKHGRTVALYAKRDAEIDLDALITVIEQDPIEDAQRSFSDLYEPPPLPTPTPAEAARRDSTTARREAKKRWKLIKAGALAEGATEEQATERADAAKSKFLRRCGL